MKKIIGFAILAAIFGGMIAITCVKEGVKTGLLIWGIEIAIAVCIVVAAHLILED